MKDLCEAIFCPTLKDEKEEGRVELAEQEARKDAAAGNQVCDISCLVHWPKWRVGGW